MNATTNPVTPRKRVLFVDGSSKFLQLLVKTMPNWNKENWDILSTLNATEAVEILDTQRVDLVVVDSQLQEPAGAKFINEIRQRYPQTRLVAQLIKSEDASRTNCLRAGAELCVLKPKNRRGLEELYESLQKLWTESLEGFRGLLPKVSLADLIQLECINMRSSVLEISSGSRLGEVFIRQGRIVHAQAGSKTGLDAFVRLMQMSGGSFHLKPFFEPAGQTIDISRDQLLLEAAFTIDENLGKVHPANANDSHTAWFEKRPATTEKQESAAEFGPTAAAVETDKKNESGVWNSVCSWLVGANQ